MASQGKVGSEGKAKVLNVRVKLLNSACLLQNWCTPVLLQNWCTPVQVFIEGDSQRDLLVDIRGEPALIHPHNNGTAHVYCLRLLV